MISANPTNLKVKASLVQAELIKVEVNLQMQKIIKVNQQII